RINLLQPEKDRDEENEHQRQGARGRFEDATNDQTPGAARQVLQHQQRETAERNAYPKNETDEIRMEELIGADEDADDQQDSEHRANNQRAHRNAAEFGRWCVSKWLHIFVPSPFGRGSG